MTETAITSNSRLWRRIAKDRPRRIYDLVTTRIVPVVDIGRRPLANGGTYFWQIVATNVSERAAGRGAGFEQRRRGGTQQAARMDGVRRLDGSDRAQPIANT